MGSRYSIDDNKTVRELLRMVQCEGLYPPYSHECHYDIDISAHNLTDSDEIILSNFPQEIEMQIAFEYRFIAYAVNQAGRLSQLSHLSHIFVISAFPR